MAYVCKVCDKAIGYVYMAEDSVWAEAGLRPTDYCCIPCLSGLLGRELVPSDFSNAGCNWIIKGIRDPGLPQSAEGRFGVRAFLRFWA